MQYILNDIEYNRLSANPSYRAGDVTQFMRSVENDSLGQTQPVVTIICNQSGKSGMFNLNKELLEKLLELITSEKT